MGHRAILLVFIYNILITIVSLYYKKSSPFDTIEISIKCCRSYVSRIGYRTFDIICIYVYTMYINIGRIIFNISLFRWLSSLYNGYLRKLSLHFQVKLPLFIIWTWSVIKAFSSKIRIRSFIFLESLKGSTCSSGNILNRNLEKNAHRTRNDESVSVHGAHFKPRCNFLPSYRIMLLLGHDQL